MQFSFPEKQGFNDRKSGREQREPDFQALAQKRREAMQLFTTISNELANQDRIGRRHALFAEWRSLKEHYYVLERSAKSNTHAYISCLNSHAQVLTPLSESGISLEHKKTAIEQYVKKIHEFKEKADFIHDNLRELQDKIEAFPAKVTDVINSKTQPDRLVNWFERLCGYVSNLMRWFSRMSKRVKVHSCESKVQVIYSFEDSDSAEKSPLLQQERSPRDASRPTEDNCLRLSEVLSDLVAAWDMMKQSCTDLTTNLGIAAQMPEPTSCDGFVLQAAKSSKQLRGYLNVLSASAQ